MDAGFLLFWAPASTNRQSLHISSHPIPSHLQLNLAGMMQSWCMVLPLPGGTFQRLRFSVIQIPGRSSTCSWEPKKGKDGKNDENSFRRFEKCKLCKSKAWYIFCLIHQWRQVKLPNGHRSLKLFKKMFFFHQIFLERPTPPALENTVKTMLWSNPHKIGNINIMKEYLCCLIKLQFSSRSVG